MTKLTRIDWVIQTGKNTSRWESKTETPVDIEIYRDEELLARVKLEPGNTPRLGTNELGTYYWVFRDPEIAGQVISGVDVPYYEVFPEGIRGHLRIKLVARGTDAWLFSLVSSVVYTGDFGQTDDGKGQVWKTETETFEFNTPMQVLSAERGEGKAVLEVAY